MKKWLNGSPGVPFDVGQGQVSEGTTSRKKAHTVENLETGKCLLCSVIRRKMNECS